MADPRVKELAYDALAISLTRPIDMFQGRGPTQSLLGEDAVSRNLRGPILDNFQSASTTVPSVVTQPQTGASQMTTALNQNEEKQFQSWIRSTDWFKEFVKEFKEEPDLNISDYNYRAAWKAGITPERDPYDQNRYHWPSSDPTGQMLKSEEHPTAWKEFFMRDTGLNPDALGLTNKQEADVYLESLKK